jgi:hypothetical protein
MASCSKLFLNNIIKPVSFTTYILEPSNNWSCHLASLMLRIQVSPLFRRTVNPCRIGSESSWTWPIFSRFLFLKLPFSPLIRNLPQYHIASFPERLWNTENVCLGTGIFLINLRFHPFTSLSSDVGPHESLLMQVSPSCVHNGQHAAFQTKPTG